MDFETVRRHARKSLGRFIADRTRRRPIVIPVVMEA
jgi:ribonuclease J